MEEKKNSHPFNITKAFDCKSLLNLSLQFRKQYDLESSKIEIRVASEIADFVINDFI